MKTLRRSGLRIFKNAFADRVPTNPSINSFIAMDLDFFDKIPEEQSELFDTGEAIGPLVEIFKRNDYKTQMIMYSSILGPKGSSNFDFYGIANEQGLCFHSHNKYALLGYCLPALKGLRKKISGEEKISAEEHFIERIEETVASKDRWLTLAYLPNPRHTALNFNYSKPSHRKQFALEFSTYYALIAADNIERLVRVVKDHDPEAVLFIMGDHGAWISRRMDNVVPAKYRMSAETIFLEQHAVVAAVYPKDFCFEEFKAPLGLARIGRVTVKCLSGGVDPLPTGYQPNDDVFLKYIYE